MKKRIVLLEVVDGVAMNYVCGSKKFAIVDKDSVGELNDGIYLAATLKFINDKTGKFVNVLTRPVTVPEEFRRSLLNIVQGTNKGLHLIRKNKDIVGDALYSVAVAPIITPDVYGCLESDTPTAWLSSKEYKEVELLVLKKYYSKFKYESEKTDVAS